MGSEKNNFKSTEKETNKKDEQPEEQPKKDYPDWDEGHKDYQGTSKKTNADNNQTRIPVEIETDLQLSLNALRVF